MHKIVPILSQLGWRTVTQCSSQLQLLVRRRYFSPPRSRSPLFLPNDPLRAPCFSPHPDRRSLLLNIAARSGVTIRGTGVITCATISKSQTNCWGLLMTHPLPVRILYPLVTPSFPTIGLMIRPTFQFALFFVVSFISTSEPFFRLVVPWPASGRELKRSCKAWRYSFSQCLRTLARQVFKYLSRLVISSLSLTSWRFSSR